MTDSRVNHVCWFGVFEVDLAAGDLRKRGLKIRLPEQAFQLLALLLERPGKLVTRDEIRGRFWPNGTYVDFDHGVNKAVSRVRAALCDSAKSPRFIETIARRGYRFLVPVVTPEYQRLPLNSGDKIRLVVLPFENLGSNPEQEWFSDGLTEEMTALLGQLNPQRLGVIARTSAMSYKRVAKRVDEIAGELNVDYVLEGSVRAAQDRVRITAQLVEARGQTHLWAENYDRDLCDILAVQSEVSQMVTESVASELLSETRPLQEITQQVFA